MKLPTPTRVSLKQYTLLQQTPGHNIKTIRKIILPAGNTAARAEQTEDLLPFARLVIATNIFDNKLTFDRFSLTRREAGQKGEISFLIN